MNGEQFERERLYQTTVSLARSMLKKGLLTVDEFTVFDTKMRDKYKPLLGRLSPSETPKSLDKSGF